MKLKLLHIVDMQNDFMLADGKLSVAGAESLIKPANEFLKTVKFDMTIATFDTHYAETYDKTEESKMFPPHCLYGTRGWELAVQPLNGWLNLYEKVLKNQFNVWEQPERIEKTLDVFKPSDTEVYIMGVASDFCVKYAIIGYLQRGYHVTVVQDLCRGINKQIDEVAQDLNNPNIKLTTSDQVYNKQNKPTRKPIIYPDFSKMDPNDPLIKALEKRRPYSSSDFVPKYMIPDLRDKQYGN